MAAQHWLVALMLLLCRTAAAAPRAATRAATPAHTRLQPYLALGHTAPITTAAWSPDGHTLATGSSDQTVILWDRSTWRPRATLSGCTGPLFALAWSPNSRWLVGADLQHTAIVWDAATGKQCVPLTGHTERLWALSWSPDGKTIAGSDLHHLLLWDAPTGKLRSLIRAEELFLLQWSPDGRTLATGGGPGPHREVVSLWDGATGRYLRGLGSTGLYLIALAWSPDGRWIASMDDDRSVLLWNPATGSQRVLLPPAGLSVDPDPAMARLAWSPDGKTLATTVADRDAPVLLWDAVTGKRQAALESPDRSVLSLSWSPDGRTLAADCYDAILLWDIPARKQRATVEQAGGPVLWSPDGRLFLGNMRRAYFALWDARTGRQVSTLTSPVTPVSHLAWSPDGRAIAAASEEPTPLTKVTDQSQAFVRIGDTRSGRPQAILRGLAGRAARYSFMSSYPDRIYDLAWSPDGATIAITTGQYGVEWGVYTMPPGGRQRWYRNNTTLWDARTGALRTTLAGASRTVWSPDGKLLATGWPGPGLLLWDAAGRRWNALSTESQVWSVAWSPDGKTLAIPDFVDSKRVCLLWDVSTVTQRATLPVSGRSSPNLVWSPTTSSLLALTSNDRLVTLWDTMTATIRHTLTLRPGSPDSDDWLSARAAVLAWSPDGKLLATGSPRHGLVKLWSPENGQLQAILTGPPEGTSHLQWSPDGRTLACVYQNHTALLWDLATRHPRATLRGHTGLISALAWSPTGHTIATASTDGSTRLWSAATGRELLAFYSLDEGKEWLAITPEGYFAASPHGADALQWRQGSKLWPLAKFRRRFERPDLVRQALAGKSLSRTPTSSSRRRPTSRRGCRDFSRPDPNHRNMSARH